MQIAIVRGKTANMNMCLVECLYYKGVIYQKVARTRWIFCPNYVKPTVHNLWCEFDLKNDKNQQPLS